MFLGILIVMLLMSFLPIIFNAQENRNTIFLSLLLSFFTLYGITHYMVTEIASVFWGAILYINFTPLYLLTGPLLYIYVRNTIADEFILKRKDLVHLIPFVVQFIGLIPYLFSSFSYKKELIQNLFINRDQILDLQTNLFFDPSENFIIRLVLLSAYTLLSLKNLYKFKAKDYAFSVLPEHQKNTSFRWLLMLHLFILGFVVSYFVFVILLLNNPEAIDRYLDNSILDVSGFFLALLIFSLLLFPDVLYGFHKKKERLLKSKEKLSNTKRKKTTLEKDGYYEILEKDLLVYFENEKPFLKPDFRMADIVVALSTPQHHINYCIKYYMKKTLPELKTSYRIEWVTNALTDIEHQANTIDAIGVKAGYGSKSQFYNAFKQHTGLTPKQYFKKHSNK